MVEQRWMSLKQAAAYLGKSRSTVLRWTERGLLPAPVKLAADTHPLYDREAIDKKLGRQDRPAWPYVRAEGGIARWKERRARERERKEQGRAPADSYTDPDEALELMRADAAREREEREARRLNREREGRNRRSPRPAHPPKPES